MDHKDCLRLVCTQPGCPRTRWTERHETDPPSAVELRARCPWHEESGAKEDGVFYDRSGQVVSR